MSNTDWIHCNSCYHVFDKELKMYILSCFHTLCRNCMKNSNNGTKCPICTKAIKFKEIGANVIPVEICRNLTTLHFQLDAKLKEFFSRETSDTLDMPSKIITFQKKQREHMVKYLNCVLEKTRQIDQLRVELSDKFQAQRLQYEKLRDERRMLQHKLRMLHQKQTPVKHRPPFFAVPSPTNELSFERAFTANGSGSSRGFVFGQQTTTQAVNLDFFSTPFSARNSSYDSPKHF